jgi:hypothetical protein
MKTIFMNVRSAAVLLSVVLSSFAMSRPPTPAPTHNYNIRIATVHPYTTRSSRGDIVYAQISVYVNKALKGSVTWDGVCDDNACPNRKMKTASYNLGMVTAVDTGPVKNGDEVTWSYEVINGTRAPTADQFEQAAAGLASSTCADPWPCAMSAGNSIFTGWSFTGCDGPVAFDSVMRAGAFLAANMSNAEWGFERRYTAADAPRGCAKSDYQLITIVRQLS